MPSWTIPYEILSHEVRECSTFIGGVLGAIALMRAIAWLVVWVESDTGSQEPAEPPPLG